MYGNTWYNIHLSVNSLCQRYVEIKERFHEELERLVGEISYTVIFSYKDEL